MAVRGLLTKYGFRSLIRASTPLPDTGERGIYAKSDGWYDVQHDGTETFMGGAGGTSSLTELFVQDTVPTSHAAVYLRLDSAGILYLGQP